MDAVEFIRNYKRMVKERGFGLALTSDNNTPEEIVAEAEKWAKEHPVKTRQSEFLKMFPNARLGAGSINICPLNVDQTYDVSCEVRRCIKCCREFWTAEVEE